MEIKLVTGTLGSGKTKYIFDNLSEINSNHKDSIIFLKHKDRTIDGDFIKSRAYSKKIKCSMVENLDFLSDCRYTCVVIDEYQYFTQEDLRRFLISNKNKKIEVILTGLKYYASGDIWESYSTIISTSKELGISCKEILPQEALCYYEECKKPAIKHSLKDGTVPDFGKLDIGDFNLYCENHFIKPKSTTIDYKKSFVEEIKKNPLIGSFSIDK